jgi:hypothetical protein
MILVTMAAGFLPFTSFIKPLWIAGLCGWTAAFLLFVDTPNILRIQVGAIILLGIGMGLYAVSLGGHMDLDAIIGGNTRLLTMIAAVGFLRLVALPVSDQQTVLPVGPKAYLQTLMGLNISSSVINISAPILLADRIHEQRPLQRFTSQSMTRVFCGVATWSPFFAAMAVVLTYLDEVRLSWIVMAGIPFTLLGFTFVLLEARIRYRGEVERFVGYPMHWQSLSVPFILVICVIVGGLVFPNTATLVVIASSALLVTAVMLMLRNDVKTSVQKLADYTVEGLPRIVNELSLFLAAGLIAAGMLALIQQGIVENPFTHFDSSTAAIVLGIILLFAAIGIHPVISISSFTPMILTLDPDPNLLAITYLLGWNLGTCSSPLSGTHLVFQGRYDIPSWKAAMWNWPYALIMYGFAVIWLQLLEEYFV